MAKMVWLRGTMGMTCSIISFHAAPLWYSHIEGRQALLWEGQGWYDHEFGGKLPEEQDRMNYAWNWAAVQLDNMHEITAAKLIDPEDGRLMETRTVVIDPKGRKTKPVHMELIPNLGLV